MLAEKNIHIAMPPLLAAEMEALAQADGTTVDEIAQNAVKRYLEDRRWQQLAAYGAGQADRLGLKSGDVPALISESRRERESSC